MKSLEATHLAPWARQVSPRSDRLPQPQALMACSLVQKLPRATNVQSVSLWQLARRRVTRRRQFSATAMTPTSVSDSHPDRSSSCSGASPAYVPGALGGLVGL